MDELRISLIVIGVVIVAGIYAIGKLVDLNRTPVVKPDRKEPDLTASSMTPTAVSKYEPSFTVYADDSQEDSFVEEAVPAPKIVTPQAPSQGARTGKRVAELHKTKSAPISSPSIPEIIVSLNVLAHENTTFLGTDILELLESIGFELAEFDIFHFREDNIDGERQTVFSVANIVKPGTFDRAGLDSFVTPGLAAFMQIPGPLTASEAFDAMLDKLNTVARQLQGTVCDEKRVPMSSQRAREIRERMLNFDFARSVRHNDPRPSRYT